MRKLSFLLIALVACFTFTRAEIIERVNIGDLYYNLDTENKTAEVTYKIEYVDLGIATANIPSSVSYNDENYSVTSIGMVAFYYCESLISVTIPNTVTSIGEEAFYECSYLESIEIPNSVTSIGDYAFEGCTGLTSVTIPNSVTSIGSNIFASCYSLTAITVDSENPNYSVIDGVLFNKNQTELLLFPAGKSTQDYTIPNKVTSIGNYAFVTCKNLTSITIGNSVASIGKNVFVYCRNLTSINVDTDNPNYCSVDGVVFNKEKTALIQFPKGRQGEYTIPNNVTDIGEEAFYLCYNLTSIEIPNSVTSIGDWAFGSCSGLTSVTIPNSVTEIGSYAFSRCTGLTSIEIPNSVTNIEKSAFNSCSKLKTVIINSDAFLSKSFGYSSSLKNIFGEQVTKYIIGNSVTSIGDYAFYKCTGLTSVTIPNSVTSIGNNAFGSCSGLTSVTIPNSVTSIGDCAFWGCSGLTGPVYNAHMFAYLPTSHSGAYTIPNGIETIAGYAFYWCTGLTSIEIPNTVTSIGDRAFAGCSCLTSVTIPNSVTEIGSYAFSRCTGLTSIEIPNTVTSIGNFVFYDCSGLTGPVYNAHVFAYLPTSHSGAYTIPNGIETIAGYAFYECYDLTSIEIPNTVTSIGVEAFSNCNNLTSIICKAVDLPTLGSYVFYHVPKDIPLYVPDGKESAYNGADQWKEFIIKPISAIPTGIKQTSQQPIANSQKLIKNGQLIILRDGKSYNIMGAEVR